MGLTKTNCIFPQARVEERRPRQGFKTKTSLSLPFPLPQMNGGMLRFPGTPPDLESMLLLAHLPTALILNLSCPKQTKLHQFDPKTEREHRGRTKRKGKRTQKKKRREGKKKKNKVLILQGA